MMKNFLCILLALGAVACVSQKGKKDNAEQGTEARLTGADRDEHGCIGSAGYRWSEVRKDCIRPWEAGIKLVPATDGDATLAAYVVFGADSTRAEAFIPGNAKGILLDRYPGQPIWGRTDQEDAMAVIRNSAGWSIVSMNRTLYKEEK